MPEAGGENIEIAKHLTEPHHPPSRMGEGFCWRSQRPWCSPSSRSPPHGAAIRQRSGPEFSPNSTASPANCGCKPRVSPQPPIRSVSITPRPWWSGSRRKPTETRSSPTSSSGVFFPSSVQPLKLEEDGPNQQPQCSGRSVVADYRSSKMEEASQLERPGHRNLRSRHPRQTILRSIRARHGVVGNRASADCHQPALPESRPALWPVGDRHPPAVLSGLPSPGATSRLAAPRTGCPILDAQFYRAAGWGIVCGSKRPPSAVGTAHGAAERPKEKAQTYGMGWVRISRERHDRLLIFDPNDPLASGLKSHANAQ